MSLSEIISKGFDFTRSFRRLAYLFLAMPLGIAYFVLLVVGLSLGAGLSVLGIGLFILAGVLIMARFAGWFESVLARYLLDAEIDLSPGFNYDSQVSLFDNAKQVLMGGRTLRSLAFLALKFPLGIATFAITLVSIVLPLSLITTPFTYQMTRIMIANRVIDTPLEAAAAMILGIVLLPISLGTLNMLGRGWRNMAEKLLSPQIYEKQKRKRDFSYLEDETHVNYYYDERPVGDEEEIKSLHQLLSSG